MSSQAEGEEAETAEDRAFIDDSENHSQGDGNVYTPGQCQMTIGYDPETDEEVLCLNPCNPAEQICHFCRTQGHRMTGLGF